jgi:phosphoglycerate dehydrogenase-like enzyme
VSVVTIPIAVVSSGWRSERLVEAVVEGGGIPVDITDAQGLIWAKPDSPKDLGGFLEAGPLLRWVQLPYAGIEPYVEFLDTDRLWTCGKGVYAPPVAEHALMLILAGFRGLNTYARATSWAAPVGKNLVGANVTILGGGGITEELLGLLEPFGCNVTVLRRHNRPLSGARVVAPDALIESVANADALVVALALTDETRGIIDAQVLSAMKSDAWLINVARGEHIVTADLVAALEAGSIGGAALDVTAPEPLPDGHPLWSLPNCLITPHVGNTPEMGLELLAARVTENVRRFGAGEELLGPVHVDLGY